MGARSAGGGAPRRGEARTDGAKTKIKASTNVKSVRAAANRAGSCNIAKWRATVDEDGQYCFAVAL
jgi:hypothetical protein